MVAFESVALHMVKHSVSVSLVFRPTEQFSVQVRWIASQIRYIHKILIQHLTVHQVPPAT